MCTWRRPVQRKYRRMLPEKVREVEVRELESEEEEQQLRRSCTSRGTLL